MALSPEKALQLLAAGEKLRRSDWDDFRYVYCSPCTDWHITDENGNDHHIADFNDFEVYEEG
jgi:hypothetical protein